MYSLDYLVEKFEQAMFDLATGEGDARSRLEVAYHRFWTIPLLDYPERVRKEREAIDQLMTRLSGRPGFVIPDNLRKMKNKTASQICAYIWSICFVLKELQQSPRPKSGDTL
jgi:hypothetical protein